MTDINGFDIRSRMQEAVREVFDTLLSMQVTLADSDPPDPGGTHRTVGAVYFSGEVTGSFSIEVNTDFARRMTARMLGLELEEVEAEENITDLIAEITNTIGGNLKSALNDQGFSCAISTPFLTSGTDFTIEPLDRQRSERVVFLHEQEPLIVDVGVNFKEPSTAEPDMHRSASKTTAEDVDFEKLNALDMKARLSQAVVEVFGTMLSMEPELTDTIPASALEGGRTLATVSFAGDVSGLVNIQVTDELTRILAANKPSPDPSENQGDEAVRGLIGELINRVGGNLKSAITDTGLTCELSPPRLTSGTDFKTESLNMPGNDRLAFRLQDHLVLVEMGMKISEILQVVGQVSQDLHDVVDDSAPPVEEKAPDSDSPAPAQAGQAIPAADNPAPNASTNASAATEEAESDQKDSLDPQGYDLDLILDIPLQILVELGRTKIQIQNLLQLRQGSAVKLTKLDGAAVDILANDTLIARGTVVVQNEKYAVQVTELASRLDRIKTLN
jgi:flagellar motor switch protein FliN